MLFKPRIKHGLWSSRWVFILAATGSAVGLGNIWKFPYIAGQNGGAAFVLVYLVCVALVAFPILMAEILIGRRGRQSPVNTMAFLAKESKRSRYWTLVGWLGLITAFLLLSFYSVIAGWSAAYVLRAWSGAFSAISSDQVGTLFDNFLANPYLMIFWHSFFMVVTVTIVAGGLHKGLERTIRVMVPALFIILLVLVGYAAVTTDFMAGLRFLFKADFSAITAEGFLWALGHAFFTLSIATASMMIYGAYLSRETSIGSMAITVTVLDTLVAILAGLAIFPIVLTYGLMPDEGAGLMFKTLPIAFGQMPAGSFFGGLFFLLLLFAALGSSISMVEPGVAYLIERFPLNRVKATIFIGGAIWFVGLGTALSFNVWQDVHLVGSMNFFAAIDALVSLVLLPLGGLMIAVFAGWFMTKKASRDELALQNETLYQIWRFLIRYVAPISVLLIVWYSLS